MRKRCVAVLIIFSLTFYPYLAWSNVNDDELSTATYGTLMLSSTTAGLTIYGMTVTTEQTIGEDEQAYLKQNHADVIEGLATGQGQFIDDLTFALNIPHHQRHIFTQKLTAQFDALADLVDTERITPSRAKQFFKMIVKIRAQV